MAYYYVVSASNSHGASANSAQVSATPVAGTTSVAVNIEVLTNRHLISPYEQVLLDIGAWLNVNGEAIYGTRPWRTYGEGPTKVASGSFHDIDTAHFTAEDFRFTTKANVLHAIGLAWSSNVHERNCQEPGMSVRVRSERSKP